MYAIELFAYIYHKESTRCRKILSSMNPWILWVMVSTIKSTVFFAWHAIMTGGCDPYSWVSVAEHQWGRGWERKKTRSRKPKRLLVTLILVVWTSLFGIWTIFGCFSLGVGFVWESFCICYGEIFPIKRIYDVCYKKRRFERSVKNAQIIPTCGTDQQKQDTFLMGLILFGVYLITRDPITLTENGFMKPKFDLRFGGDWSNTACSSSDVRWLDSYCWWFVRNPAITSWGW